MTSTSEHDNINHNHHNNDDGAPLITIPGIGTVRGSLVKESKVAKFLNIPFGIVEERWRPAVKPKSWNGTRDATRLGPMSPQKTHNGSFIAMFTGAPEEYIYEETMDERDCLNCNIFMPASAVGSTDKKLPVLVWLHDGSELVLTSIELDKPMIVVSLNYRLQCLGFISSKELILDAQEHSKTIPESEKKWYDLSVGNWGLLDQILGLQWIQENIQAFSDGVLIKQDSRSLVGDTSLYDPSLNWVFIGTCGDEGTMIVEILGATTLNDFEPFKRRICDPADYDLFDQVFGIPSGDNEAYEISSRLINSGIFKFPAFEVSEAILAHPICQLSRFHVDTVIQKIDKMFPKWGAHHGVDLPFTFGGESTATLLSEDEKNMSKKVQAIWIEVVTAASPEASTLPLVNRITPQDQKSKEIDSEADIVIDGDDEEEALAFTRDLKVARAPVERMKPEEIGFWRRSSKYGTIQAARGRAGSFGFVLPSSLKDLEK
ncbi:hypothetical protein FBU30_001747 [Linnemannia zychae]|nr:hypothetical protein FBU30_001747 [Linnemannia zychae]